MNIANEMFYSNVAIIDLKAQIFADKFQIGFKLENFMSNMEFINRIHYSINEAKLFVTYKQDFKSSKVNEGLSLVMPLMNSRQIPMFHFRQFIHHIVPIIDKKRGCVYAFTLSLDSTSPENYQANDHTDQSKGNYFVLMDAKPGLIIKYFNGIEEKVPMSLFGEEFT